MPSSRRRRTSGELQIEDMHDAEVHLPDRRAVVVDEARGHDSE